MTSLQKQLASIAANASHELNLKAQKSAYSKSLLFEPQVAASQSLDTLYQICYEGFEELCALEPRFIRFRQSLFNSQSIKEDRQRLTIKENEALDLAVESFLEAVGSRLLLKPAIKAVEWLIRKFRVHEHNSVVLVLAFLPYHSTSIFPTLISILPKRLDPLLKFLYPYINSVSNPPRSVIVYNAIHNQAFFTEFNQFVLRTCKARASYHILVSFWASVVAQTIDGMLNITQSGRLHIQKQREEDLLGLVLPVLQEGLQQRKVPELLLGCYMIVAVLCNKATLGDHVLDALIAAICQSWSLETCDAGLGCISLIVEKKSFPLLPTFAIHAFARLDNLGARIRLLKESQPVEKLSISVILGLVDQIADLELGHEATVQCIESMVRMDLISSEYKRSVYDVLSQKSSQVDPSPRAAALASILGTLEESENSWDSLRKPENEISEIADTGMEMGRDEAIGSTDVINTQDLTTLLNTLTKSEGKSYLLTTSDIEFRELTSKYSNVIHHILTSNTIEEEFLSSLSKSPSIPPIGLVTFFLRLCVASKSQHARFASLHILRKVIAYSKPHQVFFQTSLIPFILIFFTDNSRKFRQAVAQITSLLFQSPTDTQPEHDEPGSLGLLVDKFYGSKDMASAVSQKDVDKVVRFLLLANLEECVSDSTHVQRIIRMSVDDHGRNEADSSTETAPKLKSSTRRRFFEYLAKVVLHTPSKSMRIQLLSMINQINKVGHENRSHIMIPYLKILLSDLRHNNVLGSGGDNESIIEDLEGYEIQLCNIVQPKDPEAVRLLLSTMTNVQSESTQPLRVAAKTRFVGIWSQMKSNLQNEIGKSLFQYCTQASSSFEAQACQDEAIQLLRTVQLSAITLKDLLEACINALNTAKETESSKRRRTTTNDISSGVDTTPKTAQALLKTTITLELFENSNLDPSSELIHFAFRLLQALQDYRTQMSSELGYLQTLTLSLLSSFMSRLGAKESLSLDPSVVRPDLLVECVRNTSNSQARNSAILLLAKIAGYLPQDVLQSVMPILTLMSSSVARQGDDFSAYVVDQTIQNVVPILAKSIGQQKRELIPATAEIILSFAAAFEHIPTHRRFSLFSLLSRSLGAGESLFAIIATLADRSLDTPEVAQFSAKLVCQFPVTAGLKTINNYLALGLEFFQKRPPLYHLLIKQTNQDGFQHIPSVERLLSILPITLGDRSVQRAFAALEDLGSDLPDITGMLSLMLKQTLELASKDIDSPSFRPLCSRILEQILKLFPFKQFADSAGELLASSDTDVCRSLLRTLEVRAASDKLSLRNSRGGMDLLLTKLIEMLSDPTRETLKPNILACIDQLSSKFGTEISSTVLKAANVIVGHSGVKSNDILIRSLSLHCLATFAEILRNDFIPLLKPVWQAACDGLIVRKVDRAIDPKLHAAAYSCLSTLVTELPFLLTKDSFVSALVLCFDASKTDAYYGSEPDRKQLYRLAATHLEPTVLYSSLHVAWTSALRSGPRAIEEHLLLLKATILHHSKAIVTRNSRILFDLFVQALDLRREYRVISADVKYDPVNIEFLENNILDALLSMVMKINDATFRPFFVKLLDWCQAADTDDQSKSSTLRWITFSRFLLLLSEKLQSIVTTYYSYPLDSFAGLLAPRQGSPDTLLVGCLLDALSSAFKHDQDDFWQSPVHFDVIMQPVINQIAIQAEKRSNVDVASVVSELAAAAASPEHLKAMNAAILKVLRSESVAVRLAAVKCQQILTQRLGDDWLANLPEMLPIINEVQEDDDEMVEVETHKWIKLIEETLGESLNAMLQ